MSARTKRNLITGLIVFAIAIGIAWFITRPII